MKNRRPRIMIAAPASGGGKTTMTMALLQALAGRGARPAAFKCGPDYIDPMFHREALGVPSRNLDLFLAGPDIARGVLCRAAAGAGISVVEGVMGYYDGVGATPLASTWHLAKETATPAVLVVRPQGAFLSLAAMLKGFLQFKEPCMLRGILLNRCGEALCAKLKPMLEGETGLRVYGHLPDLPEASIESRHLGLATPDAIEDVRGKIRRLAAAMEKSVDIPGLIALAESAPDLSATLPNIAPATGAPVRIAVAKDKAFCFHYQDNLDMLQALGAELAFFSPLGDARLPDDIGGLYLGGGYPELHAARLAANASMRASVGAAVRSGLPTLAECGGFLYLQSRLAAVDGVEHGMAGAFAGVGRNAGRLARFGYVRLRARRDSLLCEAGTEIPAHEFHHWDSDAPGDSFTATKAANGEAWNCVVADATTFAGFPHLYFPGSPEIARRFVEAAARRIGR